MSTLRRAAALEARLSGGEPRCQRPVPAESTNTSPSRPSRRSTPSKTPWANGERQYSRPTNTPIPTAARYRLPARGVDGATGGAFAGLNITFKNAQSGIAHASTPH